MEYNYEQVRSCVYCNKPIAFRDVQHKRGHDYGSPIRKCNNCGKEFLDHRIYELACKAPLSCYASKNPVVFCLIVISFIVAVAGYFTEETFIAIVAVIVAALLTIYICTYGKKHIFYDDAFLLDELAESEKRLLDVRYAKRLHKAGYYVPRKYWAIKEEKFRVTQEWIEKTLCEIEELNPDNIVNVKKEEVNDSTDTASNIQFSIDVNCDSDDLWPDGEGFDEFANWSKVVERPTFQRKLLGYISRSGMTNAQFYKSAMIDRKLFSAINKNIEYKPKKETAVACCLALRLSVFEAEDLLGLAGYSLSMAIPWDRAVYYCMEKNIYDIDIVNRILYAMGEKTIRL